MKGALRPVERSPADQLGQVANVEHASPVVEFREHRQSLRQPHQRVVVALAAAPVDHRQPQDRHAEAIARQTAQRVLRVELALPIGVCGRGSRLRADLPAHAGGRSLAEHDDARQEDELPDAACLRARGQIRSQPVVDRVVLRIQRAVRPNVRNPRRVQHAVVPGKVDLPPRAVAHARHPGLHGRIALQPRAHRVSDEAVRPRNQHSHPARPLRLSKWKILCRPPSFAKRLTPSCSDSHLHTSFAHARARSLSVLHGTMLQ